jgi:hypothetical protein
VCALLCVCVHACVCIKLEYEVAPVTPNCIIPTAFQQPTAPLHRQILDRYSQHVRHCTHCSKALSNTQKVAARATALAFGLAAAAAAAALAKALAPVFAATAGATAVLQGGAAAAQLLPDWLSSCLGFFGPGNLLLLSAAAVVVAWAARGLERQFIFVPFDRKPFPASSGSPAAAGSA